MASIARYIQEIDKWRDRLADILTEKGIESSQSEKLNDLVPRVAQLSKGGGGIFSPDYTTVYANGIYGTIGNLEEASE